MAKAVSISRPAAGRGRHRPRNPFLSENHARPTAKDGEAGDVERTMAGFLYDALNLGWTA
jgi:hypothetical protein